MLSVRFKGLAKREPRALCAGLMLQLMTCGSVLAQEPARAAPKLAPGPAPPQTVKLGSLDVSLNWRSRLENWDWFEGDTGHGNYTFGHSLLRVGLGQKRARVEWQVEASQVTVLGLPTDAVAPAPLGQLGLGATYYAANGNSENNANAFVKQAFVQLNELGPISLKIGRFEFFDGAEAVSTDPTVATLVQTRVAHRLISNFGFTAAQRTFDGARFAWNGRSNNVTVFAARPTRGIFQVDGMGEIDVQIYYGAFNRSITAHGAGSLRIFGVGYVDARSTVLKADNRPVAQRTADQSDITIGTWGADVVHVFNTAKSGTFDVIGWGVVQTGTWGNLTQRAGAFVGEVGWQAPATTVKPWVSAGYSYGSGDGDPNDSRHGTFFQLLTTPRQYARFPFYNMMNNEDVYVTLNLRPAPKLALRSELHRLRLADAADLWYLGGGAFQQDTFGYTGRPSNGSQQLSTVWDISGEYQLTRVLSATLYYAHASGKGVITNIYMKDSDGQFAYVEMTVRF
jgi:hypothetical protein